jgi:hypothetical protein
MGLRECLQFGRCHLMGAYTQQRRAASLDHRQPQLLQSDYLRHHIRGSGHIRVGLPPPQRQPRLELAQRLLRITPIQRLPPCRSAVAEAMDINLDNAAIQQIAPAASAQHRRRRAWRPIRFQHPPQIGYIRLQRGYRRWRRISVPQLFHYHVDRHRLTHSADQQREQRSLLRRS